MNMLLLGCLRGAVSTLAQFRTFLHTNAWAGGNRRANGSQAAYNGHHSTMQRSASLALAHYRWLLPTQACHNKQLAWARHACDCPVAAAHDVLASSAACLSMRPLACRVAAAVVLSCGHRMVAMEWHEFQPLARV